MPVSSVSSLDLCLTEEMGISGSLSIRNIGEGVLAGSVCSQFGYLKPEPTVFQGSHVVIGYEADNRLFCPGLTLEDTLIIRYNGGEILIPVLLRCVSKDETVPAPKFIKKSKRSSLRVYTDKHSYGVDEAGFLTFVNPNREPVEVLISYEEPSLQFKRTQCIVRNAERLDFILKVGRMDRVLGRIPLKTRPEIPIRIRITVRCEEAEQIIDRTIGLTQMASCESKEAISSERDFSGALARMIRQYRGIIFQEDGDYDGMLALIRGAIRYNRTHIPLRLLYIYINILMDRRRTAMDEIRNLDQFMIYFDKECPWVSDVLLLYVAWLGGSDLRAIVMHWKPQTPQDLLKILLKNRILPARQEGYRDYRRLHELGARHSLLWIEACDSMNKNPILPYEQDAFYGRLLKWALRHDGVKARWMKVLASGCQMLHQFAHVDSETARALHLLSGSKLFMNLICLCLIREDDRSETAYGFYEAALRDKLRIDGLEAAYLGAAAENRLPIESELIRGYSQLNRLEGEVRAYYCMQLFLKNQRLNEDCRTYLSGEGAASRLYEFYKMGFLEDASSDMLLRILHMVLTRLPEEGRQMAKALYLRSGIGDGFSLKAIEPGFDGALMQMIGLYYKLQGLQLPAPSLLQRILDQGFLTGLYPQETVKLYLRNKERRTIEERYADMFESFLTKQILIHELDPSREAVLFLAEAYERSQRFETGLAWIRGARKYPDCCDDKIYALIRRYVDEGILFTWFEQILPDIRLDEKWRMKQSFDYQTGIGRQVRLCYRHEDALIYTKQVMRPVAFGLYVAHITLFFGEYIQYYIEEKDGEKQWDIRLSGVFMKEESLEQGARASLFDCINTIGMCRMMNDTASMEEAIETYLYASRRILEDFRIL